MQNSSISLGGASTIAVGPFEDVQRDLNRSLECLPTLYLHTWYESSLSSFLHLQPPPSGLIRFGYL
uniref:Uncharacterized protein n=1 Tax=Utricularia reniformis TaxID=192314 RepID=A0A1Y0AZ00_9LAMI|nr:hypothetical protein AEK19_MT1442 [Utricularia reniformis]ART30380.1 hypothetical protein AEK19_MT1442 [Utricularia reniformis]